MYTLHQTTRRSQRVTVLFCGILVLLAVASLALWQHRSPRTPQPVSIVHHTTNQATKHATVATADSPSLLRSGGRLAALAKEAYGKLPLRFVENRGQLDRAVAYYVQGRGQAVYFTPQGVTFALTGQASSAGESQPTVQRAAFRPQPEAATARQRWALKLDFVGANPHARLRAEGQTPTVANYFKGGVAAWHTGLKTYATLVYEDLWPGIDLVYDSAGERLKYSFVVKPGADPQQIKLAWRGATGVKVNRAGQLEVTTPFGSVRDARPVSFQDEVAQAGSLHHKIKTSFTLNRGGSGSVYGFKVGAYDRSRTLVIDPMMQIYAGYVGGAGDDYGNGIAVDRAGQAYIVGTTHSAEASFPAQAGLDTSYNGNADVFVAKLNAAGDALLFVTYLGGKADDIGAGIALGDGVYVGGTTYSDEVSFPVKDGPDTSYNGSADGFIARLDLSGSNLIYAGYFGGAGDDFGQSVAVHFTGNAYLAGSSYSVTPGNSSPLARKGLFDAFVAKVNAAGTAYVYTAFVGGDDDDFGNAVAVDSLGNVYVAGMTCSTQATFPTAGSADATANGEQDAFIAKISTDGSTLSYAGFIGGADKDAANGVAVDGAGDAYVTGYTASPQASFPATIGPDLTFNGGVDAFVAKVTANGALAYAGYIGGNDDDSGMDIALDLKGSAIVTGLTYSTGASFPTMQGADTSFSGVADGFVAKVSNSGNALVYSGYVGGSSDEEGHAVAVDINGSVYLTGLTASSQASFQMEGGADTTFNGGTDAYVVKLGCPAFTIDMQPESQVACFGKWITFSVGVVNPDVSYQWRKNGQPINNATASTYTIPVVTNGSAGSYDVVVSTLCESVISERALLTVETLPVVILNPGSQTVAAGQSVAFTAAATSNLAMTVQWQISTDNGATFANIGGANGTTLNLPPVTTAQNGHLFRAVFHNSCDATYTAAARLTVIGTTTGGEITVQTTVGTTTVTTTFTNVSQLGTTTVTPITPALVPEIPGSFALQTDSTGQPMAYNIETQTQTTGPIYLCFQVTSINDPNEFARLRVLHGEGGQLVDRTFSVDFPSRKVCALVDSLSPFLIVLQNGLLNLPSAQKAGSFLVFPYYTSNTATQKDTRLTLSNVGTQQSYVHLFLVDGASCQPADLFLCLTPNATFSFKTSEYDPENTGFVYAVAVDNQGRPIPNNGLIGNAFVRDGDYVDNYAAEAFWRYDTTPTAISNGVALLQLNGGVYDAAPIQFAVEIQSPVDTVGQKIVVAPLAGDLTGIANLSEANPTLQAAAGQVGPGLAANEQEKTVSFSAMLSGGCLKSAVIGTTFPRVPNGLGNLIPTGKAGALQFRVGAGVGLLMTPRTGTNKWVGIRALHKTALTNTVIAIPALGPVC